MVEYINDRQFGQDGVDSYNLYNAWSAQNGNEPGQRPNGWIGLMLIHILEGQLHPQGNPGVGFNNIHSDTVWLTQDYFANTYPDTAMGALVLPDRGELPSVILKLATSDGNIRYAAAHLRQLADQRKGNTNPHTSDLSPMDQAIIYGAYRAGIGPGKGYQDLPEFRNTNVVGPNGQIFLQYFYSQ